MQTNCDRKTMRKVQLTAALLILSSLACDDSADQGVVREDRFGSDYQITTNENPALPDEPPALLGDTLVAHLAYPGGCEDHDFVLETEVRSDTARLWLRHDNHGDDCEAMIQDRFEERVPEDVLSAPTILLMNPNASEPYVLRWGEVYESRPTLPSDSL